MNDEQLVAPLRELEDHVWSGCEDMPEIQAICTTRLTGLEAPEGSIRYEEGLTLKEVAETEMEFGGFAIRRFGVVKAVTNSGLLVWINGLTSDEGQWIDAPSGVPGSLLWEGATFDVSGYEGGLQHATFRPQKYSYEYLSDPSLTQIG